MRYRIVGIGAVAPPQAERGGQVGESNLDVSAYVDLDAEDWGADVGSIRLYTTLDWAARLRGYVTVTVEAAEPLGEPSDASGT